MPMELVTWAAPVELPQKIENFEEIKTYLTEATVKYRDLVITGSEVKSAEKELADLRKLRDFIDTQRKEAKKQYTERFKPLEEQYKELEALIVAPITAIDTQVKGFRESEKKAKYDELKAYFDSVNDVPFLEFDRILNPKYANKTVTMDTLKAELAFAIKKAADDHDEISGLYKDAPFLVAVQKKYADTLEKDTALTYAAILSKKYELEQKQKVAPSESAENAHTSSPAPISEIIPPEEQKAASCESERLITGRFEVTGTKAQIKALGAFMREQGIEFTTIK